MSLIEKEAFAEYLIIQGYSKSSSASISRSAAYFIQWLEKENMDVLQVAYTDVMAYVNYCKGKGNKQRTIQTNVSHIKHYYDYLIAIRQVADNPCLSIEIQGIKRKILHESFSVEELENIYQTFANTPLKTEGVGSKLTHRRNKVILALIIYQGLRTQELARLKVSDVKMREGKIFVAGSRRTEEREMALESHQLYDLMDYVNETRKTLLMLTERETDNLFLSLGTGIRFNNLMDKLLRTLKEQNPKIKVINQLRTSVITNWLKVHSLRKTQQLAGHRYVSSTEAYQVNNMDDLKEDVSRYHPDL